jgi:hypothetical protein
MERRDALEMARRQWIEREWWENLGVILYILFTIVILILNLPIIQEMSSQSQLRK